MLKLTLFRVGCCCHPEWVTLKGGRFGAIEFPCLAALIEHPVHGKFLFDTGYSHHFMAATEPFPQRFYRWVTPVQLQQHQDLRSQLQQQGIEHEEIQGVLLSHFHADHICGLKDFPQAKMMGLQRGYDAVKSLTGVKALLKAFIPSLLPDHFEQRFTDLEASCKQVELPKSMLPFLQGWDVLGDQSVIAIELPGHAVGQIGLWLKGAGASNRDVFLVADACWSSKAFKEAIAPSALSFALHHHRGQYLDTLHKLHQLSKQQPDLWIVPSHCAEIVSQLRDCAVESN